MKLLLRIAPTLLLLCVTCAPLLAQAQVRLTFGDQVRRLRRQMERRGEGAGEVNLALAALYARAGRNQGVMRHIALARKQGVTAGRTDLLLGAYYRKVGRFDAAFSTLVRVLVRHEEQPYALVELWKTLYQSKLQGAKVNSEVESIRQRLAGSGLHFPRKFKLGKLTVVKSKKLTASGYSSLLSDRPRIAAALFEEAIDENPSNSQAHRGLGIARARQHDYARAAGAYLIYLDLNPDAPDASGVDKVLMEYWKNRYSGKRY